MCHPARALRALGLLLADGARNGKSKNRFQGGKLTVMSRAKNGSSTKIGVVWQKSDFLAKNQNFGPKKKEPLLFPYPCSGHDRKKLFKEKSCLCPNNQGGKAAIQAKGTRKNQNNQNLPQLWRQGPHGPGVHWSSQNMWSLWR